MPTSREGDAPHSADAAPAPDWDPVPVAAEGVHDSQLLCEYERLRTTCPVAYSDRYGGYWSLTRYEDVAKAARDWGRFRSGQPHVHHSLPPLIPIDLDPPEHTPYRRMLNKYFGPARMEELEPAVRACASELLGPLLERGSGDVVAALANPFAARALCTLLNMPQELWREQVERVERAMAVRDDPEQFDALVATLFDEPVRTLVEARMREPLDPERDAISGVLETEIGGKRLSKDEVVAIGAMLFVAGHDTTAQGLAAAIHHLATHPENQTRLRSDPTLIAGAVEEILRVDPPLHQLARRTAEPVELSGRVIPEGELVALSYVSANRDAAVFADPDACILDRSPNKHMSFGHGVHKCVGAPLARLLMRVGLEELLARTTQFEPAAAPVPRNAIYEGGFDALSVHFAVAGDVER